MLPWVCSVIDHRRRQNVVRTSVTHSAIASCATFLFLPHFDVILACARRRISGCRFSPPEKEIRLRAQAKMTSKCGKNKKVAHEAIAECVTDVLTTF